MSDTLDGISRAEWDTLHELALEVVNAETEEKAAVYRARVLATLDTLEARYGSLPILLSIRADYVDNVAISEGLLRDAYFLADSRGDHDNALMAAHSLVDLFCEDLKSWANAREWLDKMKQHLEHVDDKHVAREYQRLLGVVSKADPQE